MLKLISFVAALSALLVARPTSASAPFQSAQASRAEAYVQGPVWPWGQKEGMAQARLDARLDSEVAVIRPWHFGQNLSWWSGKKWNLDPDRVAKLKAAGIKALRFPGGSSSDNYFWNGKYGKYARTPDGKEDNTHMNGRDSFDTDGFIELCHEIGALPVLTINYGLARYGSVEEASALAASWLRYFREHGLRIVNVEVGNESYGGWESGSDLKGKGRLSGADYGKDFNKIVAALRAEDNQVQVGAPVCAVDQSDEWSGYFGWTGKLLPVIKDNADFLIYHEYFTWPYDSKQKYVKPAYSALLAKVDTIEKSKASFDAMSKKYISGKNIPVAITEFNIINASTEQTIEAVNMLFTAEVLGEAIRAGFLSSFIWDWKNGLDEEKHGDHGMLSTADPSVPNDTPRPSFYAYAAWSHAAGDSLLQSSLSGQKGLRAFATKFKSGEVGLVLVNENEVPVELKAKLKGFVGKGLGNAWCAQADSLGDRRVRYNGESGPKGGGGPFPLAKPYSVSAPGGVLNLVLPPVSVSSVLLR